MIDPCPSMTLSLAFGQPLRDSRYFLGDEDLVYTWDDQNIILKDTLVDCGVLVVDIYHDDGAKTPPDPLIFEKEDQAFTLRSTLDKQYEGDYVFRFDAYYDQYPAVVYQLTEPFTIKIVDPCNAPYSLTAPESLTSD